LGNKITKRGENVNAELLRNGGRDGPQASEKNRGVKRELGALATASADRGPKYKDCGRQGVSQGSGRGKIGARMTDG